MDDSDFREIAEEIAEEMKKPSERLLSGEQASSLGDSGYEKIAEEIAEERKKVEADQEYTASVLPSLEKVIRSSTEEIKSMLKHLPFAGLEVLSNFEGFALVEVADNRGNLIPPSEEKSYVLSEGQTYQLLVTLQSEEPPEGIFDFIRLTDGQDVPSVDFVVFLDCDSLRFEPNELGLIVKTQETQATTKTAHVVAVEGIHNLFVMIFQRNTLVQVIPLKLEIQ
ncbi:MAG: hypothetical protein E3J21_09380 [Anaerolineales bacterium]|nr:MAG: hypothetical protein E3J21_09380 [Anaerolineales bacterium]